MNLRSFYYFWFLIISGMLLSSCSDGMGLSAEQYFERASKSLEQQEYQRAVIQLKNVLQLDPDHTSARVLLGETYLTTGDYASAEKELIRAQDLGVPETELQPYLARALLEQRKYDRLLALKEPVETSEDIRAEWLSIRGIALLAQGQTVDAESMFRDALMIKGDSSAAMIGFAQLAAANQKFSEARDWVTRALSTNESYVEAWSLLGDIEHLEGNVQSAEVAYTKALENRATNPSVLLNRSLVRIAQGKYKEAGMDINVLKKQFKNEPLINYAEGLLYFQQQLYLDAKTAFEEVLNVSGNFPPALFYAGATSAILGNLNQAGNYLERYLMLNPGYAVAQQMLSAIKLSEGDTATAKKLALAALQQDPEDVFALNLLANASLRQNKKDEGVRYLRKVVMTRPESGAARTQLGVGLLDQGEREEGVRELEKALELDPQLQNAAVALVMTHLRNGELNRALKAALVFRDENPGKASAHSLLGLVYFSRNEMDEAYNAFNKSLEIDPGDLTANDGLGAIALKSNDLEKAKQYCLDALQSHPDHIRSLVRLAKIELALGNRKGMRSALEKAIEQNPKALEPRILLARNFLFTGEAEKATATLFEIQSDYSSNAAFLELLAEAQLAAGQYLAVKSTLSHLEELTPDSAKVHFLHARMYGGLGDNEKLRVELNKAIELNPQFVSARVALARLLIEERKVDEAEEHIQALREGPTANLPDVLTLEGHVAMHKGDIDRAVAAYQKAFDLAKNNQNLLLLARARWAAGDRSRALGDLESWLREHPEDSLIHLGLAKFYLDLGRTDDAINAYTTLADRLPSNVMVLNNLAWLLLDRESTRALKYAERAYSLVPESPEVLDTLAVVLLKNGATAKAERMIDRALEKKPGQPTIVYHRAMILEATDRRDEAVQELKTILGQKQEFPERAEAESLLNSLGGS